MNLILAIVLIWNASTEPDLSGYNVYSGPRSQHYTIRRGTLTNRCDIGTNAYHLFYAVTALNTSGLESDFSNEIDAGAPPRPAWVTITNCGSATLTWETIPGRIYRVAARPAFDSEWYGWIDITGDLIARGDVMEWSEPIGEPARFYRVVTY